MINLQKTIRIHKITTPRELARGFLFQHFQHVIYEEEYLPLVSITKLNKNFKKKKDFLPSTYTKLVEPLNVKFQQKQCTTNLEKTNSILNLNLVLFIKQIQQKKLPLP